MPNTEKNLDLLRHLRTVILPPETIVQDKKAGIIELTDRRLEKQLYAGVIPVEELEGEGHSYHTLRIMAADVTEALRDTSLEVKSLPFTSFIGNDGIRKEALFGHIVRSRYSFEIYPGSEKPDIYARVGYTPHRTNFDRFDQDYVYDDPDAEDRKIVGLKATSYADRSRAEETLLKLLNAFVPSPTIS